MSYNPQQGDTGQNVVFYTACRGLVGASCPSFSGPGFFFGCDAGVVLFGVTPDRNGARLA